MLNLRRVLMAALVFTLVVAVSCATSRVYAPEIPAVRPRPGALSGQHVAVGVFDARTDTTSSAAVTADFVKMIQQAYTSATVTAIQPDRFFKPAASGLVTLRITLQAFGSGFGSKAIAGMAKVGSFNTDYIVVPEGKWNGVTAIHADLRDRRASAEATRDTTIRVVVSLPNSSGYATARQALDDAFEIASQGLLAWVDQAVMR